MPASRVAASVAALVAVASALVGFDASATTPAKPSVSSQLSTRVLLDHLTVRAAHPAGYKRSLFRLWDSHPDGCNTRYQVLIRDAQRAPTVGPGCYLTHGRWVSPYDGIATTDPVDEQIDHVVPLEAAWAAGAWTWTAATRERFANDLGTPYDLLAVSAHSNESKGDDGPDAYLPPRKSFDCRYMADYTAILWRWKLTIDLREKTFLQSHLSACQWPKVAEPARPAIELASTHPTAPTQHACTTTSSGKCIAAGEFCPEADRGKVGYDGNGNKLICEGSGEPHWKDD